MIELQHPPVDESILLHEIDAIQAFADTAVSLPPNYGRDTGGVGRVYHYDAYGLDLLNYAATAINERAGTPNTFSTYYNLTSFPLQGEFYAQTRELLRIEARDKAAMPRNDVENDEWHEKIAEYFFRLDDAAGAEVFNDEHPASLGARASALGRIAYSLTLDTESQWPIGTSLDEIIPTMVKNVTEIERLRKKLSPWRELSDQFVEELPVVDEWIEELALPGRAHLSKAAMQYEKALEAELRKPHNTAWSEESHASAMYRVGRQISQRSVRFYVDPVYSSHAKDARADTAVQEARGLLDLSLDNIPEAMKLIGRVGDGRENLILQGRAIKDILAQAGVSHEELTATTLSRVLPELDHYALNDFNKAVPYALLESGEFGLAIKTIREDPVAFTTRGLIEVMDIASEWREQHGVEPLVPIQDTLF